MNMFSYYITTHFITSNKYYNSYRNLHSVYQTYPKVVEWGLESLKGKNLKASSSKLECVMHIAQVRLISCCLILFFIF